MAIVEPIKPPRNMEDGKEVDRFYRDISLRQGYQTYAGNPTNNITPRWIGDDCLDTSNGKWYRSIGDAAADWRALN